MKNFREILKHNLCLSSFSKVRRYSVYHNCFPERENILDDSSLSKDDSVYYFEDGLRKVYPFYHKFSTFCKGRWINKNIVDVYSSEYAHCSVSDIVMRIHKGFLKVNDKLVNTDYFLKNKDLISNLKHRHELAVLPCPIRILLNSHDLLVVDKPPSIPVHPCGLYYNNTILSILANEYNINNLYLLHRLDRLTSGLLLFAKSTEKSAEMHKDMKMDSIKKEYVCRVEGNFPDGIVICSKPIKKFFHKVGVSLIHPEGKAAKTEFKKLSYNGKSSVVLCKLHSGRTHQIRVHLLYLGYPIINDPVYNIFVFEELRNKISFLGKLGIVLLEDMLEKCFTKFSVKDFFNKKISYRKEKNYLQFSIFKQHYSINDELASYCKDYSKLFKDENCHFCKTPVGDPEQKSLGMFLHASKYESEKWKFETNLPFWANENWNVA